MDDGDFLDGKVNEGTGNYEGQGPPPYQPPPGQQYPPGPYGPPSQYPPQPYQQPYGPPTGPPMPPPQTSKPLIAGIFLIIAGIEGLALGGILAVIGGTLAESLGGIPGGEDLGGIFLVCGIIFMIFGILALIGGIMSATRKSWGLALVGAIFGLFCFGLVFFEASILSLIALILIAISKDEFR